MLLPINHHSWQVLRVVLRSRRPVPGRSLRLNISRSTKEGTFLVELVRVGLLAAEPLTDAATDDPPAFRMAYTLTPTGRHAAEYGEYEADISTLRKADPFAEPQKRMRQKRG